MYPVLWRATRAWWSQSKSKPYGWYGLVMRFGTHNKINNLKGSTGSAVSFIHWTISNQANTEENLASNMQHPHRAAIPIESLLKILDLSNHNACVFWLHALTRRFPLPCSIAGEVSRCSGWLDILVLAGHITQYCWTCNIGENVCVWIELGVHANTQEWPKIGGNVHHLAKYPKSITKKQVQPISTSFQPPKIHHFPRRQVGKYPGHRHQGLPCAGSQGLPPAPIELAPGLAQDVRWPAEKACQKGCKPWTPGTRSVL